jgi:DNA primase
VAAPVGWDNLDSIERANAFDVFSATQQALGPDAWASYFEAEQTLSERIQSVVRQH